MSVRKKTITNYDYEIVDTMSVASLFDVLPTLEPLEQDQETKLRVERLICYLEQYDPKENYIHRYVTSKSRREIACVAPDCKCKPLSWAKGNYFGCPAHSRQRKIRLLAKQRVQDCN